MQHGEKPLADQIAVIRESLDKDIESWDGFKDLGFDYFVVAVLGCQSSGKSTPLRATFVSPQQSMEHESDHHDALLFVVFVLTEVVF
jgi:hypothetical protein